MGNQNQKIKICHVINQLSGGGAERLVLQLHEYNLKQGLDSYIISLLDSKNHDNPRVFCLDAGSPWNPAILVDLKKIMGGLLSDASRLIIHSHLTQSQLWSSWVQRFFYPSVVLFTTEHDTWNSRRKNKIGKIFDYFLYKKYSKIVCISKGVECSLNEWLGSTQNQTEVIYNGIDLDQFHSKREIFDSKPIKLISVGRLLPKKNFETAIRAIALLREKGFDENHFTYQIFGEGGEKRNLQELINDLGLRKQIFLEGYSDTIDAELKESDIFLLSSKWEGFGLVVAEAMASGLVSVVSNIDGVSEVAGVHEDTTILIDPNSPRDIAQKLEALINNPERSKRIARNGQSRSQEFCIKKMAQNYLKLYENHSDLL